MRGLGGICFQVRSSAWSIRAKMSDNDEIPAEQLEVPPTPEPGCRIRKIVDRDVTVSPNNSLFIHRIYINNFAIDFRTRAGTWIVVMRIVGSRSDNTEFYLSDSFASYNVHFQLTVRSTDGASEFLKSKFVMDKSNSCVEIDSASFAGKTVDMEIEFYTLEGLGIEPLRDYSVPNDRSDVTLLVDDLKFCVNKACLALHSEFFDKLFYGEFAEKKKKEIALKDVSPDAFTYLLDILHQDEFQLHDADAIFSVLELADQWNVKTVISRVQMWFQIHPSLARFNIGQKLWISDKYRMTVLLHQCLSGWQKSNSDLMTDEMFSELSETTKRAIFRKFA